MTGVLSNVTASVLETAFDQVSRLAAWPDPASGFAFHLFEAAQLPKPSAFAEPLRSVDAQLLRRAPDLAAFGCVINRVTAETQVEWMQAFERLMGREIFPADRNSFIHSPLELLGVGFGAKMCPIVDEGHRTLLSQAIQRGFGERQFVDLPAQAVAAAAERLMRGARVSRLVAPPLIDIPTPDLVFLASLALLVPEQGVIDLAASEQEILRRVVLGAVPNRDVAESAGLYVHLWRALDRLLVRPGADSEPMAKVVALCRRFSLFAEKLQVRQRGRAPLVVEDEYDVQDLLHGILKLHFDDVRPEEWTPSYAGNSSRIDFLLPRERVVIEAKMTRASLGQKEIANQLVDVARYAKMPNVDSLVCLVYDPARRCTNPSALEDDLAASDGRLRVAAVVCPKGT